MSKTKLEKAQRTRKVLDRTMLVFVILLGGFLFTAFVLSVSKLFIGAWLMGLGFIPLTMLGLALFLLFWSILDKKTDNTLQESDPRE